MEKSLTPEALRDLVVDTLEDRKALNIVALDVAKVTVIADHMVIASGTSNRHVHALSDYVVETVKSQHGSINGVEGRETAEWILIDLGDVLVHLMQQETRSYYDLERLWGEFPTDSETRA